MCGEVPIAEYLSMMSVPRHWDHLSHQNLVTFTRYRIQNLFIKSQHSFLNYSAWLVLSPSQAFTVGRAVPWCANLLMSHWLDFTEWKTWANSSDTRYQPCGSPKAIGKGHKQSSLTGENFKINLSLQIPASSFMAEMWKFTASWIQMGQHTSPNLESLQHCWNMNRLLFLLTLVISFSAANAPNAFHTYTFGATACVLEQGSQAHSPPWLMEKLPICLTVPRISSPAPRCHHQRAHGTQSSPSQGYGWCRSEGQIQLNSLKHCFPCQWSTLQ